MLLRKICFFAIGTAATCSTATVVAYLSSNPEKIVSDTKQQVDLPESKYSFDEDGGSYGGWL